MHRQQGVIYLALKMVHRRGVLENLVENLFKCVGLFVVFKSQCFCSREPLDTSTVMAGGQTHTNCWKVGLGVFCECAHSNRYRRQHGCWPRSARGFCFAVIIRAPGRVVRCHSWKAVYFQN